MRIDRRTFLEFASGAPLIFGLDTFFDSGVRLQAPPQWWTDAWSRMKELGRPGLVFIGPKNGDALEDLGFAVRDLLESGDSRAREIFCGAVVICLHPEVALACLPDASIPGVVVLDRSGRVAEQADLDLKPLATPESFGATYSGLLYGKGEERLAAEAERVRSKLTEAEKGALADLAADDISTRERATRNLAFRTEALMPLLVYERRRERTVERMGRLRRLIDLHFEAADEKSAGPRLPYGAAYEPGRGGCAAGLDDGTAIQCGMGRLEGKGQRFLRFLKQ